MAYDSNTRGHCLGWYTRLTDSMKLRNAARSQGIWNGQDGDIPAPRIDVATMAERIAAPTHIPIWSNTNPTTLSTRQEAVWMFERATNKTYTGAVSNPNNPITRGESAEFAMKIQNQ